MRARANGWKRAQARPSGGKQIRVFHISPESGPAQLQGWYSPKFGQAGLFVSPNLRAIRDSWAAYVAYKKKRMLGVSPETREVYFGDGGYKYLTLYTLELPERLYRRAEAAHRARAEAALSSGFPGSYGAWGWDEEVFLPEEILPYTRIVGRETNVAKSFFRRDSEGRTFPSIEDLAHSAKKTNRAARAYLAWKEKITQAALKRGKPSPMLAVKLQELLPFFMRVSADHMRDEPIPFLTKEKEPQVRRITAALDRMLAQSAASSSSQ